MTAAPVTPTVPDDWREMPFEQCVVRNGVRRKGSVQRSGYLKDGRFPVVDQGEGLIAGYCDDDSLVHVEPLPLIVFGDHTRTFKFVDFPFVTGADGTQLLLPNDREVDARFFYYALRSLSIPSRGYNRHFRYLREQSLWVPKDKNEQRKIGKILCNIESAVEIQERILTALRELKAATMAKLFREGLRHEPLKQTEIGEIPEGWDVARCEDLCDRVTVGIVVTPAKFYVPAGIPCFRSFNIREDRLNEKDLVFISEAANEFHTKSKLRADDVLVVRTGYPGTACTVPKKYAGANCIDLLIVTPRQNMVGSDFLARYLNSPSGKKQVAMQQGGLAQQHFNVSALRGLLVPRPSLPEQAEISRFGKLLDQRLVNVEGQLAAGQTLFIASLHALMTGALRVNKIALAEATDA